MALWRKMRGRKAAGSDQVKRATGEELLAGLPVSSTLRRSSVGSKTPGLQFTSKGEADGKVSVPDVCSCRDGDAYVSGCTNGNSAECSATGDVNEAAPAASGFSCFLVGASTWLKVRSRSSEMGFGVAPWRHCRIELREVDLSTSVATAWDGTSGDVSWCLCTRETDTGMQKDAMLSADMSLQVSQIPTADLTVFEEMLKVQPAWRGVTAVHQIQLCADHCVYEWLLITEASLRAWMIYLRMALAKVGNPDYGEFVYPVDVKTGSLLQHGPMILVFWMSDAKVQDQAHSETPRVLFTFVDAATEAVVYQQDVGALAQFGHTSESPGMWLRAVGEDKIYFYSYHKLPIFSFLMASLRTAFKAAQDGSEEVFSVVGKWAAQTAYLSPGEVSSDGYAVVRSTDLDPTVSSDDENLAHAPLYRAGSDDRILSRATVTLTHDYRRPPEPLPRETLDSPQNRSSPTRMDEIVQKQVTPVSPSPLPTEAVVSAHRHSQSLSDVGSTATQAASTPASFISSDKMSTPDRPRPPPNSVAPSPLPRRKNPGGKNGLCTATPAVSKSMEAICTTDRSRLPLPHVRNRSSSSRTQLDADFVAPFSPPLLSPRPHLSSGEPPLHDRSQSMETLQHHKMHREGDALSPSGKRPLPKPRSILKDVKGEEDGSKIQDVDERDPPVDGPGRPEVAVWDEEPPSQVPAETTGIPVYGLSVQCGGNSTSTCGEVGTPNHEQEDRYVITDREGMIEDEPHPAYLPVADSAQSLTLLGRGAHRTKLVHSDGDDDDETDVWYGDYAESKTDTDFVVINRSDAIETPISRPRTSSRDTACLKKIVGDVHAKRARHPLPVSEPIGEQPYAWTRLENPAVQGIAAVHDRQQGPPAYAVCNTHRTHSPCEEAIYITPNAPEPGTIRQRSRENLLSL